MSVKRTERTAYELAKKYLPKEKWREFYPAEVVAVAGTLSEGTS